MLQSKYLLTVFVALVVSIACSPTRAQVIVSIDSGVAPGTPNIIPGGYNFYGNNTNTDDQTSSQHGTVVARVLSTAYSGVQIIPVKIVGPDFVGSTSITNQGINYAIGLDTKVIMKSTGPTGSFGAWNNVVNAGKLAIMRAGNESESNPNRDGAYAKSLGGRAIVVGGADSNGNIAPYSNRAGDSAQVYLIAPGYNQFSSIQGTSFAAPHVGAVAAQILAQNPNLSAQKVAEIILTTAIDKGEPGVDSVYGWGLLDPVAATAPIDTGGGSSSGGGAILAAALLLGGGIAWAVTRDDEGDSLENTFITDAYDRGFLFDLTQRINARSTAPSLASLLSDFDQTSDTFIVSQNEKGSSYATFTTSRSDLDRFNDRLDPTSAMNDDNDDFASLSFYHQSKNGNRYHFSINDSIQTDLGALSLFQGQNDSIPGFEYTETFTNPFLGFTDEGIASHASYKLSDQFGFGFGLTSSDDLDRYGLESDSAVIEGTYTKEKLGLGLQLGSLREMGSLFGGASGGALSVEESNTVSVGLAGAYKITERVSVLGNYTEGYTRVDDWDQSYLQNFSNIRSNSYGLGLVASKIISSSDQFGLGYSRPLKVKNGSADLHVPTGRADFGEPLYYDDDRINLNPGASEQAFEAYYSFSPKQGVDLTTYLLHRENPDHNSYADSESTVLATLKFRF